MPLLIDLVEVHPAFDDAAIAGEEEHVGEGAPGGVDETPQSAEEQDMHPP